MGNSSVLAVEALSAPVFHYIATRLCAAGLQLAVICLSRVVSPLSRAGAGGRTGGHGGGRTGGDGQRDAISRVHLHALGGPGGAGEDPRGSARPDGQLDRSR